MSKSVLVIDTPKSCYNCPFGTEYYDIYIYKGNCELAEHLGKIMTLLTEEYYVNIEITGIDKDGIFIQN